MRNTTTSRASLVLVVLFDDDRVVALAFVVVCEDDGVVALACVACVAGDV
jgi:hypothetical protein